MEEKSFVDELYSKTTYNLGAATKAVLGPTSKLYENMEETRNALKRHCAEMFGIRASKIRKAYGRRLQLA
jgi:hypothetical protein